MTDQDVLYRMCFDGLGSAQPVLHTTPEAALAAAKRQHATLMRAGMKRPGEARLLTYTRTRTSKPMSVMELQDDDIQRAAGG